jgi:hypothetical protein
MQKGSYMALPPRRCACGAAANLTRECFDCQSKRLMGKPLQKKLLVNEPGDVHEQEADRAAELVMRMPAPRPKDETPKASVPPVIEPAVAHPRGEEVPPVVHEVLSSAGRPLDQDTRAFFEPRFGHDFRNVRIHADCRAANSAARLNAAAYTVGRDIVFGSGGYAAGSQQGKALLAHELAHVVQQRPRAVGHHHSHFSAANRSAEQATRTPTVQRRELTRLQPAEEAAAYIPDVAELQDRLSAMTERDRHTFVLAFVSVVRHQWHLADALGLVSRLENIPTATRKMALNPVQPIAELPQNAPQVYGHKLQSNVSGSSGTRLGRQLVMGDIAPAAVAATPAAATNAIMSLRRLNDVLTRVLSAQATSQATGTPIEDVLALYRVEGDLAVPPGLASLEAGIPSGTTNAAALINPRPDFTHLVWLVAPEVVRDRNDPSRDLADDSIKERALTHWFVQLGGLDEVGLLPQPKQMNFARWSSKNWLDANNTDPVSVYRVRAFYDAWNRWSAQIDNLEVRRLSSETASSRAVMVAPKDPQLLISGILSESVMRHRAGGKLVNLLGALPAGAASPDLTPGLAYLQYNAGQENFKRMLASAAVAAARTRGPRYGELRNEIAEGLSVAVIAPLLSKLGKIGNQLDQSLPKDERDRLTVEQRALTVSVWSVMVAWFMADPRRLQLLGDFVETASPTLWSSWTLPRGNMSRYNVLRAFYQLM